MKSLLAIAAFAVSSVAFAQCTETFTQTVSYDGAEVFKSSATYVASLTKAETETMTKRAQKVIDVASRQQDKGGKYTITFGATNSCGEATPDLEVQGVTAKGYNAINRASLKAGESLVKDAEDHANKGHKKAWGKD